MNYLWDLCFWEKVQTPHQLTQAPGGSLQGPEGFLPDRRYWSGFVLMIGIGNVDDSNADIWYLSDRTSNK